MFSARLTALSAAIAACAMLSTTAFGADFTADQMKSYASGEKAAYLAGAHMKGGMPCTTCHTDARISDSESEVNARCTTCHEPSGVAARTSKKDQPNPHKSHIGDVQCTACHSGHTPSVAYCTNCHDFPSMKNMKHGNGAKPASQQEDLSKYDTAASPVRTETVDLLIVGSGAAGFTAAFTARDAGVKNIVMVEKMAVPGGNSQLAAGGMNATGTRFQKAAGITDTPDMMFADTMKGGKNVSNPDLVRILADESNKSIEWLASQGAELSHVGRGGGASAARMHGPAGGVFVGPYLSKFFRTKAKADKLDLRLNSKLVKLVTDKSGRVVGGLIRGKHSGLYQINARAVILATGGIGANSRLVQSLRPDISADIKTSNQPGSQGDGMVLAQKVGAALVDEKEIQLNPTLLVGSPVIVSEIVRGSGAVFVNREGKRFISELTTRDVTSAAVSKQTGGTAFEIFDDRVRTSVKQTGAAFELGLAKHGNTLAELAKNAGINAANLEATIAQYNKYAEQSNDPDFKRPGINPKLKVEKAPFYAIEITPAIHYYMGGLKFDAQTRVINTSGKPIQGLYAAGEVTGGLHGKNRLGGNSISETITFGRLAGANAAKEVLGR